MANGHISLFSHSFRRSDTFIHPIMELSSACFPTLI
jgi:hypothetical protein